MFNAILGHESFVMLHGHHLTGVSSVSISSRNTNSVANPIGTEMGLTMPSGPTEQSMSLSRYLIYRDPIYNLIGKEKPIKGEVHYEQDNSYYGFQSGYINNYSINCAVGSLPRVNTSFTILDEIKSGINLNAQGNVRNGPRKKIHAELESPYQKTILIESEDFQDNRVVGFDYSVSVDYDIFYRIGSTHACDIKEKRPIKYSASVQLELDKTYNTQTFDFLDSRQNKNININIKGRNGTILRKLDMPNPSLVSRNLSQSANGLMLMNLSYVGHLGADRNLFP